MTVLTGCAGLEARSGGAEPSKPDSASVSDARKKLDKLKVKGRAPRTGFDRDEFGPAWSDVDHNGCDTRNDILKRDLKDETFKSGTHDCIVLTGTLDDPYGGKTIKFRRGQDTSTEVQIDHLVPLSDAWQKGAQQWSETKRKEFANDPLNLLAVDGPLNNQKSDSDAATWLPPRKGYRCAYIARQIDVKAKYDVWVTSAEKTAMEGILADC
ncbi:MAG: HNH endonuclease [Nonomuraea sp.]|nr:HNH endonuclease [Nonomuraea sp.]NUP61184.1 HNH endonuclease [Nonomuraea sp.]NUS07812.1 HNH endonuclease [Nonomuraea sp.]